MSEGNNTEAFIDHVKKDTNLVKSSVDLKTEKFGWTEIEHGLTDEGDYVWHFSNHHKHRRFPNDLTTIKRIIVTYLSKAIPEDIKKLVIDPPSDWEKKVLTVKAFGFGKLWNYDVLIDEANNKYIPKIGELISEEIEKANPRRTHS